jgi:hypothetical protein
MAADTELSIDLCERGHVLATWRNLVIQVYGSEARATTVERATHLVQAHARLHPSGIGMVVVVSHMGRPPDEACRAGWSRQMRAGNGLLAALILMEGEGLRASVVRSVATGLLLLARRQVAIQMAATVAQGLPWFVSEMERSGARAGTLAEVTTAIHAARARALGS